MFFLPIKCVPSPLIVRNAGSQSAFEPVQMTSRDVEAVFPPVPACI